MKARLMPLLPLLFWSGMQPAMADVVVVSNPKSGVERLSQQEVVFLFMGRWHQLPSGIEAQTLDQAVDSPQRTEFYRRLVNKDPAQIRAYWSRLTFSGGTRPPRTTESSEEMIRLIAATPGAIGYLERSQVDARLRVVYEFPPP